MRVYAVQAGEDGPLKIGIAACVRSRVRDLQCSSHHHLTVVDEFEGSRGVELALHRHLRSHRIRGEWFNRHPEVMKALSIARQGGAPALHAATKKRQREERMSEADTVLEEIFVAFDPDGAGSTKMSEYTGWPISTIHSWKTAGKIPSWRRPRLVETAYRVGISLTPAMLDYLDPERKVPVPAQLSFKAPPPTGSPSAEARAGANRAEARAERAVTGWAETAYTYLRGYAARHSRFLAEEVRAAAAQDGVPVPPAPGAWGNIFKRAAREKLIQKDGYAPSKQASTHGKAAVVWIVP